MSSLAPSIPVNQACPARWAVNEQPAKVPINLHDHRRGFAAYPHHLGRGGTGRWPSEPGCYSQNGEDGMLEAILGELGVEQGWVVEIGAGDGMLYSAARRLVEHGWAAVLIEGGDREYAALQRVSLGFPRVRCLHQRITLAPEVNLNAILARCRTPHDFDVFVLDVDGNDYWFWKHLQFQPKVVVVEYNSAFDTSVTIPYDADFVWDGTQFYGASAPAFEQLGRAKGYDLIGCGWPVNLVFIKSYLNQGRFRLLSLEDRDAWFKPDHHRAMRPDQRSRMVIDPWPYI